MVLREVSSTRSQLGKDRATIEKPSSEGLSNQYTGVSNPGHLSKEKEKSFCCDRG